MSPACPLVLPSHVALDRAREARRGDDAIGTTCRGIGPAYEDKVGRRAVRAADLADERALAERVRELLDLHNFMLERYYGQPPVDAARTLDELRAAAPRLVPMIGDVAERLRAARAAGRSVLFEGAQGSLLDIDHGTYPFVTSSNTMSAAAALGSGVGPGYIDSVLGVAKAYTTRVGGGPFPTELDAELGERLRSAGNEYGATTGRAAALRLARRGRPAAGDSGEQRRLAVRHEARRARRIRDAASRRRLSLARRAARVSARRPQRRWRSASPSTKTCPAGAAPRRARRSSPTFPAAARRYLERIEALLGVPIVMVSTSAERGHTIMLRDPFA